ncbi:MAG: hypothetical protein GY797_34120, partial [Deltaproteobacteria bacterium]|nr:hypothetical protein [Deltaproteobacteria bacterium]
KNASNSTCDSRCAGSACNFDNIHVNLLAVLLGLVQ